MKKLLYLFMMTTVILSFTACGSDGENEKKNPESGNNDKGGSTSSDVGKDGLKGYWLQNGWQEASAIVGIWESETSSYGPNPDQIYSYPVRKGSEQKTMFEYTNMIYLDGEGGGTVWIPVSTDEKGRGYFKEKLGNFSNITSGESFSLSYLGETQFTASPYGVESWLTQPAKVLKGAIVYYLQGTTLQVFYGTSEMWTYNVANGQLVGFQRLSKMD